MKRRKNFAKRLLPLALVLVMLLSYLPGAVVAGSATDILAIAKPQGIRIVEDYDDYVGDDWLASLELPESVEVTLANGTKTPCLVTWDASNLDMRTTGYYSLPGNVLLPVGATNTQNLTVSITVQVFEYINLVTNPGFEDGTTGWKTRGDSPFIATDYPNSGKNALMFGVGAGGPDFFTTTDSALAKKVAEQGSGQYYFAMKVRQTPGTAVNVTNFSFYVQYSDPSVTSSTWPKAATTESITVSKDAYQTLGGICTLKDNVTGVRLRAAMSKNVSGTWEISNLRFDDVELVPLKFALEAEPSAVKEIKSDVLSRKVVLNYPDYVGSDWKNALGLPARVEIVTDNGDTVEVGVTWSFAELDFTKYGKYTLYGTLDDTNFPNPKGIKAVQNIYVGKTENLLTNPSFEGDLNGWYLRGGNPNPTVVTSPVKDGKYAAMTGTLTASGTEMSFMDSRRMDATLFADIAALGGGQFYMAAWHQYAGQVPDGMTTQLRFLYKVKDDSGNMPGSSTIVQSPKVPLVNGEYTQVGQVLNLPENVGFAELVMYVFSKNGGEIAASIYVDATQLTPINVKIPKDQEPSDVEKIIEEIPVRAVVQNYDTFVGDNWQSALGLPATVQVLTSSGNTAAVGVEWNYENLNLKKTGKYVLTGTLDNSAYPNPKNLYVTQTIYIVEYKNLLTNPGFESGLNGWYLRGGDPNPSSVTSPVKDGKYAAMTGTLSTTGSQMSFADTRRMDETLHLSIAETGAGQYYTSGWSQYAQKMPEGMQLQVRFLYKTIDENGNLSDSYTTVTSDKADMRDGAYTQAKRIFNLPANIGFAQMVFYVFARNNGEIAAPMYFDSAELVPLNVIVEQYDGEMVQVETVINDRQIIQNYPDYIGEGYTTKDLMLPETVQVRSSTGEVVKVGVRWDYSKLNLEKTGSYTVYGALEDMKIANPDGLTVKQTIRVVSKQNIFSNSSFEDDDKGWDHHRHLLLGLGNTAPVRTGSFSLKLEVSRMEDWTINYLQAFYNGGNASVGQKITKTGAGRYYYGAWLQGTESSNDLTVNMRLYYRCLSTGDQLYSDTSATLKLPTDHFVQVGNIVELPDDIYMAHADLYMMGTPEQLRMSTMFIDDMELLPLNVEIANLTDIVMMESSANIYVHQGTSVEGLKLPETLEVTIKTGQKFDLKVHWNTSAYNANKVGTYTITGTLELGKTYKNPKNFVPTVTVVVRPKGEELRETIYFSTSGDDANDGLSPDRPKQDIKQIGTYLQKGYNVRLKRGDAWYLPGANLTWKNILGTEDAPMTLGAYGSGEMPIIAFMLKIDNSTWKLVDEKRNVYAADVSTLPTKNGVTVHRCFGDDVTYTHKLRSTYVSLDEGEYCSYDKTLYLRMPEGQAPSNITVTPYGSGGHNLSLNNISYLNVENIHIKGGNPTISMMFIDAPTNHLRFTYCSITHGFNYHMVWETDDENIHYKPEVSYCYIDSMLNEQEGWFASETGTIASWNVSAIEGITMRDGVDGAWIHHNHLRNMSHAFISIESTQKASDYTTTGVRNCIVEDNLCEGGYAMYARAFNICGGFNLSDIQMCRDNTFRRNRAYDMTSSSHLFGENNLVYSNLFSFHHMTFNEDGTLFEGKQAMPGAFDTIIYSDHTSVGNMLVNNTFYNCGSAICISDTAHTVTNNLYANNLIVNWTPDVPGYPGAFYDNSIDFNYVMNNGVYSHQNYTDHFLVDKEVFRADDVNKSKSGYSGNIAVDPKFVDADLSNMDKYARMEFDLSSESPMRYAGLSLYDNVYAHFPAWERLKADYTDLNGVVYLAESPSIGAYSYAEKIGGEVAQVGELEDILARPGAVIEQLNLPRSVPAVNDEGIDVVLLIDWKETNFDSNVPGTYTLTGSLRNGPHTELNVEGKTVSININVKDKLELMDITTVLKKLTVFYNSSFEEVVAQLPKTLSVVEESGFEEDLPITWVCDSYDPTKPGAYIFKCVLPEDMLTNAREFNVELEVRLLHEIGRGSELLINPDFIDDVSAAPWKIGWGTGNFRVTTDPQYLMPGEPAAAIVTMGGRYGSIQQDVLGQMQLMGDGQYLFKVYMRAYEEERPIDSTYACLKVWGPRTYTIKCRVANKVGTDWVEFSAIMDAYDLADATEISFHTSTGKTDDDVLKDPKSYIIAGCSLVYLGKTDAEVEATMDSVDLVWNTIKGENASEKNVMTNLNLPTHIGLSSSIKWTSSDESVISNDGKVTMGRDAQTVILQADITYGNIVTTKKFTVTVPRDPELPVYTGSLTGEQTVSVGDTFNVVISTKSDNATAYNAFRFVLSFSASNLEFVGISGNFGTKLEGGRLEITGAGAQYAVTDTITVTFKAKKAAVTDVKLVEVAMDNTQEANAENLPVMKITNGTATIKIEKTAESDHNNVAGEKSGDSLIWIIVGIAAMGIIAGAVVVLILMKKKQKTAKE